jgi:phytoene synthase
MVDPSTSEMVAPALRPVYAAARDNDVDRYLSALLSPPEARDALISVAAFAGEIARIPLVVSDPALAQIRLQWWRDAVEAMSGPARTGNPVADTLADTLRPFPGAQLFALDAIEARMRICEIVGGRPVEELAALCSSAETATFRLAARVIRCDDLPAPLCEAAGTARGVTDALLALPRYLANGLFAVPDDASTASMLDAQRARARACLETVRRELGPRLQTRCLQVFLPLALVEPYLRALERDRHDALRQLSEISPLTRIGRLAWARWRSRI